MNRSGKWRSSARDAPGVERALNRLGKRVRTLRLTRKLTQEKAAELAKLDEKHWQDIEGARTNPTLATLVGIARALKMTLSGLFDDTVEPEPARADRSETASKAAASKATASKAAASKATAAAGRRRARRAS
jgi:transcriptional regulator with XRE-family HTH domain